MDFALPGKLKGIWQYALELTDSGESDDFRSELCSLDTKVSSMLSRSTI